MEKTMDETLNITCPDCGATLSFDASTGRLKCEYCGCELSAEEAEAFFSSDSKNADDSEKEENKNRYWDFEESSF
ncbi:MAG: hypothetical protein K6G03_07640, partial [Lachnospiraceae bacterium]|nr:hypothetical protein [Lachnospiraceae bacterium]